MNGGKALQTYDYEWDETINGKVVPKRPEPTNHNVIKGNLTRLFINYLRGRESEYFSGVGLFLSDGEIYIPDGALVSDPEQVRRDGVHGPPDLVVEILSYRTARHDRGRKKDVYEQSGTREYWIVSPEERSLERYFLRDGKFVLQNIYYQYPDYAWDTDPEERAELERTIGFRYDPFPDLPILMEDVFRDVRDWG